MYICSPTHPYQNLPFSSIWLFFIAVSMCICIYIQLYIIIIICMSHWYKHGRKTPKPKLKTRLRPRSPRCSRPSLVLIESRLTVDSVGVAVGVGPAVWVEATETTGSLPGNKGPQLDSDSRTYIYIHIDICEETTKKYSRFQLQNWKAAVWMVFSYSSIHSIDNVAIVFPSRQFQWSTSFWLNVNLY